jgi:predicted  nucleic acid-binding Zn-ribbon protein
VIEVLRTILALQKIDLRIRELEIKREELPKPVKIKEKELTELKNRAAELTERTSTCSSQTSLTESSLIEEREKLKKWEKRLNDIKTPREAMAMQREVETQKRTVKELEEKALILMEDAEKLKHEQEENNGRVTVLDAEYAVEKKELDGQIGEIEQKIAGEKKLRDVITPKIERHTLSRYEQIKPRRQGLVIVPIVEHRCSGCNMAVPPQQYNTIMADRSMEFCNSCQRILYLEETKESAKE